MFEQAVAMGMEGVIGKPADSIYKGGQQGLVEAEATGLPRRVEPRLNVVPDNSLNSARFPGTSPSSLA